MDRSSAFRLRELLPVILALVLLGLWAAAARSVRLEPASDDLPRPMLVARASDGTIADLRSYRGEVILVEAWADWCGPCRSQVPRLNRLDRDLKQRGVTVLGLHIEPLDPDRLRGVASELGIEYRVATSNGEWDAAFRWDGRIPALWLIDRQGRLRARHVGPFGERSMRRALERLLAEPRPALRG